MTALTAPQLLKAKQVHGKTLTFRDAATSDAAFILSLRTNVAKSRFLSQVSSDVSAQEAWLTDYASTNNQAYFIIEQNSLPIGTVRLYDPQQHSFCWGSWILKTDCPTHAAIESALMVYAYATDHLGFNAANFDVRKANERVWQFHQRFGAKRVAETELDYFYEINQPAIDAARQRYAKFLPTGIKLLN
jgi:RimJ/RimL family protein N-acetyltransferase